MMRFISSFLLVVLVVFSAAADNKADSLLNRLKTLKADTSKVNEIVKVCKIIEANYPDKAIEIAAEGIEISEKYNFKPGLAMCYQSIGLAFHDKGNYEKAVSSYLRALKLFEELKDIRGITSIYSFLGSVSRLQGNYNKAIDYYNKALQLSKESGNKKRYAIDLLNLGCVYYSAADFESALKYFESANESFLEFGNKNYAATCLQNIGSIYFSQGKFDQALENYNRVLNIRLGENDHGLTAQTLNNLAEVYKEKGDFAKAIDFLNKSLILAKRIDSKEIMRTNYENFSDVYLKQGDYKRAFDYFKLSSEIKDSIFTIEGNKHIQELSVKYETEKKDAENQILRSESERQRVINWAVTAGLLLLAALAFFIFRGYQQKQKANLQLEEKNLIIEEKNKIVGEKSKILEEKNKDITDSIKYAKRIQEAILPPEKVWQRILPNSFVLYKPKDILSGDFYWIEETADNIFAAAVDCTGHGVPGALMSVVGFNLLNKAVLEKGLTKPAQILDEVNKWLTVSLRQTFDESSVRDGMDIAFCTINKINNTMQFAGAFNPVYIFNENGFKEIKGDKFPVGIFMEDQMHDFTNHEITLQKGDSIYLFSDGFADQFGGPNGKKFKYNQFQKLLSSIQNENITAQKIILAETIESWKGSMEQVDDILVVGIKI